MAITKIQAAKAQLATAIRLYFEDRDPISVHTLVAAAAEIIGRICTARGIVSMRNDLLGKIIPTRQKEVGDRLNQARNFFKHASTGDPTETFEFSEDEIDEINLMAIVFAVIDLMQLGESMNEMRLFNAWITVTEPKLVVNPQAELYVVLFGDIASQPRRVQKQVALDVLYRIESGEPPPKAPL